MKRVIFLMNVLAFWLMSVFSFAQAPQKMSYQAVVRDADNHLLTNTQVGVEINIYQDSASGTIVYTETQSPTTNASGLLTIEIGGETGFDTISWENGPYFLETKIDPNGGTDYTIVGKTQLLSVPFALYAKTAESVTGNINETDPVFSSSVANGITGTDTANWNSGFGLWKTNGSNVYHNDGNVGIGITNPIAKLEVNDEVLISNSSGDPGLWIYKGDANIPELYWGILNTATDNGNRFSIGNDTALNFSTFNEKFVILNTGEVGIGTNNPTSKLEVNGNIEFGASDLWQIDEGSWTVGSSDEANIRYNGTNSVSTFGFHGLNATNINVLIDGAIHAGQDGTADDSYVLNGNFGVGTTTPEAKLDVNGAIIARANNTWYLRGGDDAEFRDINEANFVGIYGRQNSDRAGIRLGSNTESYIFGKNGNIGIGTTTPTSKLDVNGTIATTGTGAVQYQVKNATAERDVFIVRSGTNDDLGDDRIMWMQYHRIDTSQFKWTFWGSDDGASTQVDLMTLYYNAGNGKVGIGTISPTTALHVRGEDSTADALKLQVNSSGKGHTGIRFQAWKDDASLAAIRSFDIGGWNGDLRFYTDNDGVENENLQERVRIDKDGNVGIGITTPARKLHISGAMRLEPLSTPPSSPATGDMYMDDGTNTTNGKPKLRVYDGSTWQECW